MIEGSRELPCEGVKARNLEPRFGERSVFCHVHARMPLLACRAGDLNPAKHRGGKPQPYGENQPVSALVLGRATCRRGVNNSAYRCPFPGCNNAARLPPGFPGYKLIKPSAVQTDVSKYKLSCWSCRCAGTSAFLEHAENGILCIFFILLRKYYSPANLISVYYLPRGELRVGLKMVAAI